MYQGSKEQPCTVQLLKVTLGPWQKPQQKTSKILLLESVKEREALVFFLPFLLVTRVKATHTSLSLTIIMVNSKNPKKSIKYPTLPPRIQDSSQSICGSSDLLNLLSKASLLQRKASTSLHCKMLFQNCLCFFCLKKSFF